MPKKKTQAEFISEANSIHNNFYDYTKVKYINATTKVNIICPKHGDFLQQASAHIFGQGCPFCSGRKACKSNSILGVYPHIAEWWHPTKNEDLAPDNVVARSNSKVWWKCPVADDHEWEAIPDTRVHHSGCPFCEGNRVCLSNSFGFNHPNLISEWHQSKNKLTPYNLVAKSGIKVWWKCPVADDHEWEASPATRVNGHGCPCCFGKGSGTKVVKSNCLETTHPHLMKKWDFEKNIINPSNITYGSQEKVWWKCPIADDHRWKATVGYMSKTDGCPCCSGFKVVPSNCLNTTNPELIKEWHTTKNKKLTPNDVLGGGRRKVWWKCPIADDHEWQAEIINRVNGSGCPHCASKTKVAVLSTCLATVKPEIVPFWHPTKNGNLTPYMFFPFSETKIWWKCPVADDHEWKTAIANLSAGNGCPCCSNKKVVQSNCFETTHPEYLSQWHKSKNGDITPKSLTGGSSVRVWWQCEIDKSHTWLTSPNSRFGKPNRITGCPHCAIKIIAAKNQWWTTELFIEQSKLKHGSKYDYSQTKYLGFTEKSKITCPKHGEFWQRPVAHLRGAGCPSCAGVLKKSTEEFVAESQKIHGDKYDYSRAKYISRHRKLTIICPKHGPFGQRAACHLKGCGCSLCSGAGGRPLTTEEFIVKAKEIHGKRYVYDKVVYTTSDQRIIITCRKHGDFEQQATSHLQGCDCPKCARQHGADKRTLTKEEFLDKAKKVHGDKYLYHKANYVNMNTKIVVVCQKHGDFEQCPANHVYATASCPKCRESKGETKVRVFLENAGIKYRYNHRFSTCRNVNPLPFDFVIWHNGKIAAIEFQGTQHYMPMAKWHGDDAQEQFEKVQKRDQIKEDWCKQKGIPLLKIPYWKSNELTQLMDTFLKGI